MPTFHRIVLQFKHWQVFVITMGIVLFIGYPLFLLGKRTVDKQMHFMDSPAIGVAIFLCLGIWLDAVLKAGGKPLARAISPILLIGLTVGSFWLKYSPYGMFIFLPAIAFVALVMVPAAKAIHTIEMRNASPGQIILDTVLVGCFFPFGVWILQARLNVAMAQWNNTEHDTEGT